MLALVAIVVAYSLIGLAISLVTLWRYVQENGALDAVAVLLTIREVLGEALSFIWFLLLFHMWGLLDLKATLSWSGNLPPPITSPEGQAIFLLLLIAALGYVTLYSLGKLWWAFFLALAVSALAQIYLNLLDFAFLLALLLLGLVSTLGVAWALFSELHTFIRRRLGW
jgi:hypothetical protein